MKRQYTHLKVLEPEIIGMRKQGKTRQEIADALGLTKTQIKHWDGDTTGRRSSRSLKSEEGPARHRQQNNVRWSCVSKNWSEKWRCFGLFFKLLEGCECKNQIYGD